MQENIVIRGVRQNNLKGFDLTLPRNKLIVFTGLSGCGKSSLAFDTLYAEGQRRYRIAFLLRASFWEMEKPDGIPSTAFPPSPSTRRRRAKPAFHSRHGDGNSRLFGCSMPASVWRTAPGADGNQQTDGRSDG
ncbi:MAG: hypothetical protein ACLTBF_08215 [Christensenellales bacterium]